MLFPVQGTHILETAYYLPVFNTLIKNWFDKGRRSHFTSFLNWSKSLHSFCLHQDIQVMNHMLFFSMLFPVCVCVPFILELEIT